MATSKEAHDETRGHVTGSTGGTATGSVVAGIVEGGVINVHTTIYNFGTYKVTKNQQPLKQTSTTDDDSELKGITEHLKITIKIGDKKIIFKTLCENQMQLEAEIEGVVKVNISTGSVTITLTLEKDFRITEDWIQSVLRTIFDDILGSCIAEEETFIVNVQRHVTITEQELACPADGISAEDRSMIESILSPGMAQTNFQIFPVTVAQYLTQNHAELVTRLSDLPRRNTSVIIATRSLLKIIDGAVKGKPAPKSVLCDVCVFSPTEPVLVLTLTTGSGKTDDVTTYNSELTGRVVQTVRSKTKYSFSAVSGVVEESLCQSRDEFREKISQLQRDAHVMSKSPSLVMTLNKCLDIIKPIVQLLSVDEPADRSHVRPEKKEDEKFAFSKEDFSAMMMRIEQLEQAQADFKKEKEIMSEKFSQGIEMLKQDHLTDIEREKEILSEKFREEIEKLKQNHLTDTRLSLLMRPRSPSFSESGYGSADLDVEDSNESEAESRELSEEKDKDTSKVRSDLTAEAIETGDLVQYNRDITLHQACSEGNLDAVKYILFEEVSDINCRGKEGRTPAMESALKGQVAVFEFLISQGCDLLCVDDDKYNVLHAACKSGNIDIVRTLVVNMKYDIESKGYIGRTAVMRAAYYGQKEVFDFLVNRGSELTTVDNRQNTILHLACCGGNVDILKYLLSENIAAIESRGFGGRTPIMSAVYWDHKEAFDFLVSQGSDLSAVDDDKYNVLHAACKSGNIDIVKRLVVNMKYDIERKGYIGRTAVMRAAYYGQKEVFDFLVNRGSDLTVVDNRKNTILHLACCGGNVAIVELILSKNIAGIESRGFGGRTPIMAAVYWGHKDVFDFLVSQGSDVSAVDDDKYNVLHASCKSGNIDIAKMLVVNMEYDIEKRGYIGRTAVMRAAYYGHKEVFDLLVSRRSDLTVIDNQKKTILNLACYGGNVDIVKYIMSQIPTSTESTGRAPVMVAVLNTVDDEKNTILHVACTVGHVDIVRYLLTLSAVRKMVKLENKYDQTPVQVAKEKGHTLVVSLLENRQ